MALSAGVMQVCTYDVDDWKRFREDGLTITGPPSALKAFEEEIEDSKRSS